MRRISFVAALAATVPWSAVAEETGVAGGLVSEVKAGLLWHDVEFLGENREDGVDLNAEVLFASPAILEPLFAPRPHLGVSVNSSGNTSQLYAGLTWELAPLPESVPGAWVSVFGGGTVHNGEQRRRAADQKSLGSHVLFRLGAEIGYDVTDTLRVSIVYEHASNANLADENEGLNNAGIRIGWRF